MADHHSGLTVPPKGENPRDKQHAPLRDTARSQFTTAPGLLLSRIMPMDLTGWRLTQLVEVR
jgi:hypothetical protein